MYIGGAEHSVLHLLYTRFLTMVFHDWKIIRFDEPFKCFRAHGLLIKDGIKMSKSKGNVVNPDEYIKKYGADALRMYLMFLGPFTQGGDFRDDGIAGITRFRDRSWRFVVKNKSRNRKPDAAIERAVHQTIKKVTEDIEELHYNTAISALMILLNEFEARPASATGDNIEAFVKMLAPFAPHFAEELWKILAGKGSIHKSNWPVFSKKYLQAESYELVIQVNGRVRASVKAAMGIGEEEARRIALENEAVKKYIPSIPNKVIFVKNRLINFVV